MTKSNSNNNAKIKVLEKRQIITGVDKLLEKKDNYFLPKERKSYKILTYFTYIIGVCSLIYSAIGKNPLSGEYFSIIHLIILMGLSFLAVILSLIMIFAYKDE